MNDNDRARAALGIVGFAALGMVLLLIMAMLHSCRPWHTGMKPGPCPCCPTIPKG